MYRVVSCLLLIVGVFASLLTFPSGITLMLVCWVIVAVFRLVKRQSIWWILLLCLSIFVIKQPGYSIEWFILVFSYLTVGFADWRSGHAHINSNARRQAIIAFTAILFGSTCIYGAMRFRAANTSIQKEPDLRPIACLGDSLTAYGYPEELAKRLTVPVADFGMDGIKTKDGIEMLPEIIAVNPQAVVIELGGHDYNSGELNRSELRANMVQLIEAFQKRNIAVILVEIPRGLISDPFHGVERELAATYDLQLINDSIIRTFIFLSPDIPPGAWLDRSYHYSDDGLHPNKAGNRYFAKVVCNALQQVFGKSIRR